MHPISPGGWSRCRRAISEANPESSSTVTAAVNLFAAIGADPEEASKFFGFLTGVIPIRSFFSPAHLIRLVGVQDFLRLARARSR